MPKKKIQHLSPQLPGHDDEAVGGAPILDDGWGRLTAPLPPIDPVEFMARNN